MIYEQGKFVTVGWNGTILSSADGITWTPSATGNSNHLNSVAYGEGAFVAIGADGAALRSADLEDWSLHAAGTNSLWSIAFGNGNFIASDSEGVIWISPDSVSWSPHPSGSDFLLNIDFGNGVFIAMGGTDTFLRSTNGIHWQAITTPYLFHESSTFAEGVFVTVGINGAIITSTDGSNWLGRKSDTDAHLFGVCYGNGTFVVVGQGIVLQSDFISATTVRLAPTVNPSGLLSITFSGAIEEARELQASGDLSEWTSLGDLSRTNLHSGFVDEESTGLVRRFYRAVRR